MVHAPENAPMGPTEDDISMNPTDHAILDLLADGRVTPSYVAEETGYTRGNIVNRLQRLVEHGHVTRIHKGLYELVDDPRDE